jgi:DNA-binding NarL/FixJ family response regulator
MVRVWIAAPTPALRLGLRALLDAAFIDVVGESGSGPADGDIDVTSIDAFVLDSVPLDAVAARRPLVLLSDDPAQDRAIRALRRDGYALLPLDVDGPTLSAAVLAAARGLIVSGLPTPEPAEALRTVAGEADGASEPITPLSAREIDVLELAGRGLPSKMIAAQLEISESTVKFHLSSIYAKLGVAGRVEAISAAVRLGLLAL